MEMESSLGFELEPWSRRQRGKLGWSTEALKAVSSAGTSMGWGWGHPTSPVCDPLGCLQQDETMI